MEILRLFLFLGLVLRRVLLEILKRKERVLRAKRQGTGFIKFFKGSVQLFLAFQTLFLDLFSISTQPDRLKIIGTSIFIIGLATTMIGRLQLGKNWANIEDLQVLPDQSLVSHGIYRFIRHPIYAGDFLLFVGLELALNSWVVLGALFILPIVIRQSLAEEALLAKTLPGYNDYCTQTKRFIPFIL